MATNAALAWLVAIFDRVNNRVLVMAVGAVEDRLFGVGLVPCFAVMPGVLWGLRLLQLLVTKRAVSDQAVSRDNLWISVAAGAGGHAGARELGSVSFVALAAFLGGLIVSLMLFVAKGEVFDVFVGGPFGVRPRTTEKEEGTK